ncbi:hypothetical protein JW911_03495 [Candidatus Peregrinibacteria bacterium]|nr:hypothetical protein [Candidatus Peregrinibacteria bacterium]
MTNNAPKKFSLKSLIAIFTGLLVIAVAVGAIIYSQSGERLKGELIGTRFTSDVQEVSSTTTIGTRTVEEQAMDFVCDPALGYYLQPGDDGNCVCNDENNFVANTTQLRTTALQPCVCKEGYTLSADGTMCNPLISAITRAPAACDASQGLVEYTDDSGAQSCVCRSPFIANPDYPSAVAAVMPCLCPDNTYYENGSCLPIDCDLAQKRTTPSYIAEHPEIYWLTQTTITTLQNYDKWFDENCVTCESLLKKLSDYYNNKDINGFNATLKSLKELECIGPCTELAFIASYYMKIDDLTETQKAFKKYFDEGCGDCNQLYNFVAYMAIKLSEQKEPDLTYFKSMLEKFTDTCGCLDLEKFLEDPGVPVTNRLVPSTSLQSYNGKSIIPTAYAQSTTFNLSPAVREVIQQVYDDKCVPDEKPVCKTLIITKPTSSDTWNIAYDYVVDEDFIISVDDAAAVYNYKFSSSTGKFKFNDVTPLTDNKMSVNLTGGPAQGGTEVIKVEAYDAAGTLLKCTDTLTVIRGIPPPVDKPKECYSLQITAPQNAAAAGQPTVTISESGYINEELKFTVDTDSDVVSGYRIRSDQGTIKFDGQGSVYDVAANVFSVKMNGGPDAGEQDSISIWAMDKSGKGISSCADAFIVKVDKKTDTPPPPETPPPTTTVTQTPPTETPKETLIPPVVHAAAPTPVKTPSSGPEILLYFAAAGIGGFIFNKKRK